MIRIVLDCECCAFEGKNADDLVTNLRQRSSLLNDGTNDGWIDVARHRIYLDHGIRMALPPRQHPQRAARFVGALIQNQLACEVATTVNLPRQENAQLAN